MILVIDNFDSFTYNIVQCLRGFDKRVEVRRNNDISVDEIRQMAPSHIIISPGPGGPDTAGVCLEVVERLKSEFPIFGLCLGHQCIGQAFGGKIKRAGELYHGRASAINHDAQGVFAGLPPTIQQVRYHSLVIDKDSAPDELIVTAWSEDGEIMGVRHKTLPIEGVQFHPESVGSPFGVEILRNFVEPRQAFESTASLQKIWERRSLEMDEARHLAAAIVSGRTPPAQVAAFLTALGVKGESVDEIAGFAVALRQRAESFQKPPGVVVDNCGTGGDASGTFNISTVAAIVAAAAGARVAKHGNRAITSKCGSADLLEALGVDINAPTPKMERSLAQAGLAFLYAPKFHPSLKNVAQIRRDIGVRTIFNLVGPLVNPAGAEHQIIGVFHQNLTQTVCEAMARLGIKRGLVFCGDDGLDELTLTGETQVAELRDGEISAYKIAPEEFGLERCDLADLQGGTAEDNKRICLDILGGVAGPKTDIVLLNAAAALYIGGQAAALTEGVDLARAAVASGAAAAKLRQFIDLSV